MVTVIGVALFVAVMILFAVVARFVHRREAEMDYPEAHGTGLQDQKEAGTVLLGTNAGWFNAGQMS